MPLRAKVTSGPVPAGPGGWCGGRAVWPVTPGLIGGSAPNSSVWMRAGSMPSAARAVPHVGHERGRAADVGVASAGTPSAASAASVRRPGAAWPRRVRRRSPCCRRRARGRAAGRRAGRGPRRRAACSRGPRAPWIHQTSRSLRRAASSCSMASTGVTPMPAEMSSTGPVAVVEHEVAAGRRHVEDRAGAQRCWCR